MGINQLSMPTSEGPTKGNTKFHMVHMDMDHWMRAELRGQKLPLVIISLKSVVGSPNYQMRVSYEQMVAHNL